MTQVGWRLYPGLKLIAFQLFNNRELGILGYLKMLKRCLRKGTHTISTMIGAIIIPILAQRERMPTSVVRNVDGNISLLQI